MSSLTQDGEGGAEVCSAAPGRRPSLEEQPGGGPVLVDQGHEERSLGLGVHKIHLRSGQQEGGDALDVAGWREGVTFTLVGELTRISLLGAGRTFCDLCAFVLLTTASMWLRKLLKVNKTNQYQ